MHVRAAQVERPGNVVEGRQDEAVGLPFGHGLADEGELLGHAPSGIFQGLDADRGVRQCRAGGPQRVGRVPGHFQADAVSPEVGLQGVDVVHAAGPSVDAHAAAGGEDVRQPSGDGRRALDAFLHQAERRARQLFRSRKEIAGVGPERGVVARDHRRPGRPVETRNPLACLPVCGRIFAVVRVGTGENVGVQAVAVQILP